LIMNAMNFAMYNDDSYFKCFPNESEEEFVKAMFGLDLEQKIEVSAKATKEIIKEVRMIIIDDEYFEWLANTMKTNTEENRSAYMQLISDEDAQRLWKKNKKDFSITTYLLPIAMYSPNVIPSSNFKFPEKVQKELQQTLSNAFKIPMKHIMLHPEMHRLDYLLNDFIEYFEDIATSHFTDEEVEIKPLKTCLFKQDKANMALRFIPIAVKEYQDCIFILAALKKQKMIEERSIPNKPLIALTNHLQESQPFITHLAVTPFVIDAEEAVDFYKEWEISTQSQTV
jgi:hypothetical protein